MKTFFNIYEPNVTVYDKDSKHTALIGERCKLDSIFILNEKPIAILINSQNNKLNVPYDVFKDVFYISGNQLSPL